MFYNNHKISVAHDRQALISHLHVCGSSGAALPHPCAHLGLQGGQGWFFSSRWQKHETAKRTVHSHFSLPLVILLKRSLTASGHIFSFKET